MLLPNFIGSQISNFITIFIIEILLRLIYSKLGHSNSVRIGTDSPIWQPPEYVFDYLSHAVLFVAKICISAIVSKDFTDNLNLLVCTKVKFLLLRRVCLIDD